MKKLLLPLMVLALAACSSVTKPVATKPIKTHNKPYAKESAVRTLLDGTWIVRKTNNTPVSQSQRYYHYYAGLHAKSIGCKSYSELTLKVGKNEKAYKCMVNGTYLTKNHSATGLPWE